MNTMSMIRLRLGLLGLAMMFLIAGCALFDKDSSTPPQVDLYPIQLSGQWGYINDRGAVVITPRFQNASTFSEGKAMVRTGNRWHYIDTDGEIVINGQGAFQELKPFREGLAAVRIQGRWGFIRHDGTFRINPLYRSAEFFSDGRAFVRSVDFARYLYIDADGTPMTNPPGVNSFNFINEGHFNDGRALVRLNDRFGYIGTNGEVIVEPIYQEAMPFSGQLAAVKVADRWGYIGLDGQIRINPQFISAGMFADGRAPARRNSNQYGYIDTSGTMVIAEQFDQARAFADGMAAVRSGALWGFVNTSGSMVIPPQFTQVEDFHAGLARFTVMQIVNDSEVPAFGYVNRNGVVIWPATR